VTVQTFLSLKAFTEQEDFLLDQFGLALPSSPRIKWNCCSEGSVLLIQLVVKFCGTLCRSVCSYLPNSKCFEAVILLTFFYNFVHLVFVILYKMTAGIKNL